jgi:two-component system, sensor histidine kinase and response regulator
MNRKKIKLADVALDRLNHEFNAKAEELGRMNKKHTDLLAFKEVMIIFLAHDLKNTLNTLLNSEIKIDPIQQLSGIRITGRYMLNVVDNMLGIIGFENGSITLNIQAVSYNKLMMNVFRRIKIQSASRSITLSYNHEKNYTLAADADISERILVNLLDNAIRHASAGSSIEVTAEMLDGFIKTMVKDQGEGISPGLLPVIFEKYTHADNPGQSAARRYGLGLAFCKMAVEKHGGITGVIS